MSSTFKKQTWYILKLYAETHKEISYTSCIRCSNVIFAALLMKQTPPIHTNLNFLSFQDHYGIEFEGIINNFPELYRSYLFLGEMLSNDEQIKLINEHQKALNFDSDHMDDFIAWFYQYSKIRHEKKIFSDSLKNGTKISGIDILPVTQFFTDRYMVKRLVEDSLSSITKEKLPQVRIIDPACGGGNFLAYAFEYVLYKYQITNFNEIKAFVENNLVGYDLDIELAGVAKINLYLKYYKITNSIKPVNINIFGGAMTDCKGFLDYSKSKENFSVYGPFNEKKVNFKKFINSNNIKIILTNPPFMGRRNMDIKLKKYLSQKYPISKSDLCVSFINSCLQIMETNDILGVVTQTSWLYLSSFNKFRHYVLNNFTINICYDLGSDAFKDINGEKANIALMLLSKKETLSTFYYLKKYTYLDKKEAIEKSNYKQHEKIVLNQKHFLKNSKNEILYLLSGKIDEIYKSNSKYGFYATPMQGTSTGNNQRFIENSWIKSHDPDWVLVSKGGGYCKWQGLNHYRVKWGNNASLIKENPGSAVRNLSRIKETQLVYTDTGTSGLSVRVLLPKQVFIASGPGIRVLKGKTYAHLGFLNSRFSSFFLKILSPKLTISAVYIKNIPVIESILHSSSIANNAKKCVGIKNKKLCRALPNEEFINYNPSQIKDLKNFIIERIKEDLNNELSRLQLEYENETIIANYFNLTDEENKLIADVIGIHCCEIEKKEIIGEIGKFDAKIYKCLDVNTSFINGKMPKGYIGSEGIIEYLSYNLQTNPINIHNYLIKEVDNLNLVKSRYLFDILHKSVLFYMGFMSNTKHNINRIGISEISKLILSNWPDLEIIADDILGEKFSLKYWLDSNLVNHHNASFHNNPLIKKNMTYFEAVL